MEYRKYPRSLHFSWSPGATSDDKMLSGTDHFVGQEIIVSEKLDGENTTIYPGGYTHARSLDSRNHPSRDWMRAEAARIGRDIPEGVRVNGENCFAVHSITYSALPSYFMVFGMVEGSKPARRLSGRDGMVEDGRFLDWDTTVAYAEMLGLHMAPVLYRGPWDEAAVKACYTGASRCGGLQEGYVARLARSFPVSEFGLSLAKYVRENHVDSSSHWMHERVIPNGLRETSSDFSGNLRA